jgi:predicted FMN-binding regulatory protein PaiB
MCKHTFPDQSMYKHTFPDQSMYKYTFADQSMYKQIMGGRIYIERGETKLQQEKKRKDNY